MQIWRSLDEVPGDLGRTVVTVGNFDGVHLGHQHVAAPGPRGGRASWAACRVVAVTFDPHPMAVLRPEHAPPTLTDAGDAAPRCSRRPASTPCWSLPFDREVAAWTPERVRRATSSSTRCTRAAVVVGANFRFGAKAAGDVGHAAPSSGRDHDFAAEGIAARRRPAGVVLDVRPQLPGRRRRRRAPPRRSAARSPCAARSSRATSAAASSATRPPTCPPHGMLAAPADGVYAGWLRRLDTGEPLPGRDQRRHQPDLRRASGSAGSRPTCSTATTSSCTASRSRSSFVDRIRGMLRFDSVEELVAHDGRTTSRAPASCCGRPGRDGATREQALRDAEQWFLRHGLPYFVRVRARDRARAA